MKPPVRIGVGAALLVACLPARPVHAQAAAPGAGACYRLVYDSTTAESPGSTFAGYVALDAEPDRMVRSGEEPGRPSGFWRMFLVGGRWRLRGDTLELHFTNGFSGVEYRLVRRQAGVLAGRVTFHWDVITGDPPPSFLVVAEPIDCARAQLQSSRTANRQWLAERRAQERRSAFLQAERSRLRAVPVPFAGTYRFEMIVPGAAPVVTYGRTAAHPESPLWQLDGMEGFEPPARNAGAAAPGYAVPMAVARTPGELPDAFDGRDTETAATAAFFVLARPHSVGRDSTSWEGRADVLFAVSRLVGTQPLDSILGRAARDVSGVWLEGVPGSVEGRVTVRADGTATAFFHVRRGSAEVFSLRGRRISRVTLRPVEAP